MSRLWHRELWERRYSAEQWARLTDADKAAIMAVLDPRAQWCDEHQRWDYPDAWNHGLDFGWTCSCWQTSSGWPGVTSRVSFRLHKHGAAAYTNALWSLFLALVVLVLVLQWRGLL